MDVVGSEIGQKMRSAIKAKLTELGCYVDDELPDYVMVMVANKRTRAQMEDDLQLFLGDNTELFVNWLHQVLKKLQEVTITTPAKTAEAEKVKEKTKDKKSKGKKEKGKLKKIEGVKKAKKKVKSKSHKKKDSDDKKPHKSKKKSKHHEMIRPNVPPLLMNMEKDSEPSITDIFAGQILKNHGVSIADTPKEKPADIKPIIAEIKRPILPIIDPATISTQPELDTTDNDTESSQIELVNEETNRASVSSAGAPREDQIKEMSEIEAKIQGLKQKLAEQLDSMSDDEDFLNIRTEAEELMNDFAEDVFMEISSQAPVATPPIQSKKSPSPPIPTPKLPEPPKDPEVLPQIELNLPKRPVRERLGTREETKKPQEIKEKKSDRTDSPERFTPEREPDFWPKGKSARSRLGSAPEPPKRITVSDDSPDDADVVSKRLTSKVSTLEKRPRATCASVVRVRPRPRVAAPASSLLMRAVADAHKSLLNIPPKSDSEPHKVKRALVLPMRRCIDTQNIVIQVHGDGHADSDCDDKSSKVASDVDKDEYVPSLMTKKVVNSDYVPSRRSERTSTRRDDTLIIETINIHKTTAEKDKNTQFIVTMDGFNPNSFLAKKLENEGLLKDSEEIKDKPAESKPILKATEDSKLKTDVTARNPTETKLKSTEIRRNSTELELEIPEVICADSVESTQDSTESNLETTESNLETIENVADTVQLDEKVVETEELKTIQQKRLSNTSDESDTQVIITREADRVEKRLSNEARSSESSNVEESPPVKKRKASPIVFNVSRKEKQEEKKERERTESVGSDSHVTVTTVLNTHKYDAVPSLSQAERKLVWCRLFPLCRYGASCAFQHPRCKFAAGCTRRNCVYAHGPQRLGSPATPPPAVASHVVPAANFKSITPGALPTVCKYYPSCANPSCPYWHPKPCRYGPACANRLECNFYHSDGPAHKWRYPV